VHSNGLHTVSNKIFCQNQADIVLDNVKYIWAAAHRIFIPCTAYYYGNNTIELFMINCFRLKPLNTKGDMQTTSDNARIGKHYRNRPVSIVVDDDKEDDEEELEEVKL